MRSSAPDPVEGPRRRSWLARGPHRSRGAAEAGLALTVAALVVGALIGNGLAATNLLTSDGLTWLGDSDRGTAVQIDPTTGQPQTELKVAPPGQQLVIGQRDGLLVINNTSNGTVTLIDVATLVATGRRTTSPAGATEILLDANQLYLVDRPAGLVHRIDPRTAADIGQPWRAGTPLADAALDGAGVVWALGVDSRLHALAWSPQSQTLVEATPARQVAGTGPQSQLVPHEVGVTVFAPESNHVVRVGTANDITLTTPTLDDPLRVAPAAPAELVPASLANSSTVLILNHNQLLTINVGSFGCPHPGKPVVHRDRVYVPCLGSGKVLVLSATGEHLPPDIATPSADPQLVLDDGHLIIHNPGADTGIIIDADGTTRVTRIHDESVPARDPPTAPPSPTPTPTPTPNRNNGNGNNGGDGPRTDLPTTGPPGTNPPTSNPPTSSPPTSNPPTSNPPVTPPVTTPPTTPPVTIPPVTTPPTIPPRPTDAPSNVAATARTDATVVVTWTSPQGQPGLFRVLRADDLSEVATVGGTATSALVTTLPPGTNVAFFVGADYGGGNVAASAASNAVVVFTNPGAPVGVTIAITGETATSLTVEAQWSAAADNGSAVTGYVATVRTDRGFTTPPLSVGYNTGPVTVSCNGGCDGIALTVTVHAANAAGDGPDASNGTTYSAPAAPVITFFSCEFIGNNQMLCDVSYSGGPSSIRWAVGGFQHGNYDDQTSILVGCTPMRFTSVSVTISNVSGSDTQSGGASCDGEPR